MNVLLRLRRSAALVLAVILTAGAAAGARAELSDADITGYRIWLHALEHSVAARTSAGTPERLLLFPFDRSVRGPAGKPSTPSGSILTGAASELERAASLRTIAPERRAFAALARARNRVQMCRFDSALVWYDAAAALDTAGSFHGEIARESLATAVAAGDAAALERLLDATAASADLSGRGAEVVLAYRTLLARGDTLTTDRLITRVAAHDSVGDARIWYWHAVALVWRGRTSESLASLTRLLRTDGLTHGLNEAERAWVLTAVPDLLLLDGEASGAHALYDLLAASQLPEVAAWGAFQSAGLDLAAGRFALARAGYARLCAGEAPANWQARACGLAELADSLVQLSERGEAYGVAYQAP